MEKYLVIMYIRSIAGETCTSDVIHTELGIRIKDCLRNPESFSTQFSHYVRKNKHLIYRR